METLNQKLERKLSSLRQLIADKEGATELLDEVNELTRQAAIPAVEVEIPEESVIKRYPISEAMEIVRCKTAIFFHSTCFWVISEPTLANNMQGGALYEMLSWYCDYMDRRDEMEDSDEKDIFDTVCAQIANILSLPLDVFTDTAFMLNISNYILKARNIYYDALAKQAEAGHEDTVQDLIDNQLFEERVKMSEELKVELSKTNLAS